MPTAGKSTCVEVAALAWCLPGPASTDASSLRRDAVPFSFVDNRVFVHVQIGGQGIRFPLRYRLIEHDGEPWPLPAPGASLYSRRSRRRCRRTPDHLSRRARDFNCPRIGVDRKRQPSI